MPRTAHLETHLTSSELKQQYQSASDKVESRRWHLLWLVSEHMIPPGNVPSVGKLLDINMLVMCLGGKERTEAEYHQLLAAAEFKLTRVIPTNSVVSIVEGIPIK
jgi:hypothetical protein